MSILCSHFMVYSLICCYFHVCKLLPFSCQIIEFRLKLLYSWNYTGLIMCMASFVPRTFHSWNLSENLSFSCLTVGLSPFLAFHGISLCMPAFVDFLSLAHKFISLFLFWNVPFLSLRLDLKDFLFCCFCRFPAKSVTFRSKISLKPSLLVLMHGLLFLSFTVHLCLFLLIACLDLLTFRLKNPLFLGTFGSLFSRKSLLDAWCSLKFLFSTLLKFSGNCPG